MSALPPVTGASAPKPEQVEALARLLARDEQTCIDLLTALDTMPAERIAAVLKAATPAAIIPTEDLMTILRAAVVGWAEDVAGHYHIRIDKPLPRQGAKAPPAVVKVQPGERTIWPDRRKPR